MPQPNRVVAVATALVGLGTAIAGPIAALDTSSTAALVGGAVVVAAAAVTWLVGWQKHEGRVFESTRVATVMDRIVGDAADVMDGVQTVLPMITDTLKAGVSPRTIMNLLAELGPATPTTTTPPSTTT